MISSFKFCFALTFISFPVESNSCILGSESRTSSKKSLISGFRFTSFSPSAGIEKINVGAVVSSANSPGGS